MDKEMMDLIKNLMLHTTMTNLDMSGQHRYHLTHKAHEYVQKIKYKLHKMEEDSYVDIKKPTGFW